MHIQTFVMDIDLAWNDWQSLISALTPEQLTTRTGEQWSVKDHIAHITWYEREMITVAIEHKMEGSDWWNLSFDERTQNIFERNKERTLEDIIKESHLIHTELRVALSKLEDDDLTDSTKYLFMPEDWLPLEIFAGSTNNHYREHTKLLHRRFAV